MVSPPPEVLRLGQDMEDSMRRTSDNLKAAGGTKKGLADAADYAAGCAVSSCLQKAGHTRARNICVKSWCASVFWGKTFAFCAFSSYYGQVHVSWVDCKHVSRSSDVYVFVCVCVCARARVHVCLCCARVCVHAITFVFTFRLLRSKKNAIALPQISVCNRPSFILHSSSIKIFGNLS